MIKLVPFKEADFSNFISWVDCEETLVTIAGYDLSYPLTNDQLHKILADKNIISFIIIYKENNTTIGHAEIVLSGNDSCKIDKLIIGDHSVRGKGVGEKVILELLRYAFAVLAVHTVELNVFDWNKAAIRCYEKCGFIRNEKQKIFQFRGQTWAAFNMTITKEIFTMQDRC